MIGLRLFLILGLTSAQLCWSQTPESAARGKYMVQAAGCINCHGADFDGGVELKTDFGRFYGPSITADKKTGIGSWSDKQFLQALKLGVSPIGKYYYPAFPFTSYTKLSESDILDMRNYLSTLPAVSRTNRSHQVAFPFSVRKLLFVWRKFNFKSRGTLRPVAGKSPSWNRGAYLVEAALHCTECHTPRNKLGGLRNDLWMAGAIFEGEVADNITSDRGTGKGDWSVEDWNQFLKTGELEVGEVSGEMRDVVTRGTSLLSEEDRLSVAEYLHALRPITRSMRALQPLPVGRAQ